MPKKIIGLFTALLCAVTVVGCSTTPSEPEQPKDDNKVVEPALTTAELQIGQVEAAAHGTKCFTTATVVLEGDKILLAYLDEYQFLAADKAVGVPNSETLADYWNEGVVLASKRVNAEMYSANMAKSGSTVAIDVNYNTIQDYVAGKTIAEVEALAGKTTEELVDTISGATLVDMPGYLSAIVDAAKAAQNNPKVTYEGDVAALKIGQVEAAAHGKKAFTLATAVTANDKVVLAYLDEFQYLDGETATGVPNSETLKDNLSDPTRVLGSKRVNTEMYSANMAKSGSTIAIDKNFDMIQDYVSGKTIAELKDLAGKSGEEVLDTISSTTLVDAGGYVNAIVAAATASK